VLAILLLEQEGLQYMEAAVVAALLQQAGLVELTVAVVLAFLVLEQAALALTAL
tara:strand:+ start:9458 stop:9619 length:162 start_codon:yes stop_codon:yes gene_type:complete